jgi:hypothetical protein
MTSFKHPDIDIYYKSFLRDMKNIEDFEIRDANDVKIKSILNTDIYTKATRFLEGSIKNIIYNCCIIRGDNGTDIDQLISRLKNLNNPKFENIKRLFQDELNFDIEDGLRNGSFSGRDKTLLNEIVLNRHLNVHASEDASKWYNANSKDLANFNIEFESLVNVLKFIDDIKYSRDSSSFYT